MAEHAVGTRYKWPEAQLRLPAVGKERIRRSDEPARRRQEQIDSVSLADLFGGRS